jgi:nicotinamidase-related amidase
MAAVVAMMLAAATPGHATSIVTEWASVRVPPAPELKPVAVDPRTTALLMLDFMGQNCGKRPRCLATIPAVKRLLAEARERKMPVVYSFIAKTSAADVIRDVAPASGELSVTAGPDKFLGTDLEKILKGRNVQTVIAVGTSANGAVLYTASAAAARGMSVVVPVDGMSSAEAFADLVAAWQMANAPVIGPRITLSRIDLLKF